MTIELILDCNKGSIEAPAGCGKTQVIVETLKVAQQKPYLVLTHTTAGVAALRKRLNQSNVPTRNYVISTIDGWCVRIANSFSNSCALVNTTDNPNQYYNELRSVVDRYISSGNINDVIISSYSRLIVDEYQDCNQMQHNIICAISQSIPTTVLGDPMQLIFDFGNTVIPDWRAQVLSFFPLITELDTPWRWKNAGNEELGEWVLFCRQQLLTKQTIDLNNSPSCVRRVCLTGNPQTDFQLKSRAQYDIRNSNQGESLLVIGDSRRPTLRHQFAGQNMGVDVVEPVELRDLLTFAENIDTQHGQVLLTTIINNFGNLATGMGLSTWLTRMNSIIAGRNRKAATSLELALLNYITSKNINVFRELLVQLKADSNVRVYRLAAYRALEYAVDLVCNNEQLTLKEAMVKSREKIRQKGDGRVPHIAIGSTLLLKGLEANHCLILDAQSMNPQHLYVAISRGAKSLTVGSNTCFLH